jgi:hypothetical protein
MALKKPMVRRGRLLRERRQSRRERDQTGELQEIAPRNHRPIIANRAPVGC